ncbi:MAG TPA: metallopeptidase TldD-related protein [Candidatus Acidoferrales bacterium]|nr:metallopeptidase TldD-related protein [Candidatus Acidoferrales bacterium]
MKHLCRIAIMLLTVIVAAPALGEPQGAKPAPVLEAMKAELARSMETFKSQPVPPYFLSYEITETYSGTVSSSFGKLTGSNENRSRLLNVDLRVGDYALDNTRQIRGAFPSFDFGDRFTFAQIPIEDDADSIRSILWYHTDKKYKRAAEQLTRIQTNIKVKVAQEDKSNDFSRETPEKFSEDRVEVKFDRRGWEDKVRKYTAPFASYGDIYEASATYYVTGETRWFVSSEGAGIQTSQAVYRLFVSAFTKAADGMELPRYVTFAAFSPEGLPDDAAVLRDVDKMIADLKALREAPVVEPYTGPAILTGRASGVFFHEVFGHRIEGHRQKDEDEGQTFKKKIGEKLLPETFSVYFDPTMKRIGPTDLVGAYRFDNQGVKARRVPVIEKGVFKNFLLSRAPIEGFAVSNGHGRGQAGLPPVARQSNLIVENTQPVSPAELRKMLIEQIKKENKPFGLIFEDIEGGFTMTGRFLPNAFNVIPILVYRLYPDGRQELVRGVDLIGTPLTAFSKIVAADTQVGAFNGICGAESGGVPVAAVSPGVLISQIEVQKKDKSKERPPILPAPFADKK